MKKLIILFAALLVIVIGGAISQNYLKNKTVPFVKTPKATIGTHSFNIILAKSQRETEIGLSERNSLDKNSGMLFVFGKADYPTFWMKNMKFPIDIIFIKDNKIVTIYEDVKPPKSKEESLPIYKPEEPADKVLEINAGLSEKYIFKKGDEVKFENI